MNGVAAGPPATVPARRRPALFSDNARPVATSTEQVNVFHLSLAPRPDSQIALDDARPSAFQQELAHVHRSFLRLGALSFEVEDLTRLRQKADRQ
jgi:hypothetical protein